MSNTKELTILLAEDCPYISKILCSQVQEKFPFVTIKTVSNGAQGKEILGSFLKFDLIITDYQMPLCDGLELIYFCKDHEIETPIIVYHGSLAEENTFLNASRNCFSVVEKPNYKELILRIEDFFNS